MRAYSFLLTLNGPEILFSFKKITAHLTTLSTHGVEQEDSKKHYANYTCDSGHRIVFEELHAGTDSQQDQKQTAYDGIILLCHQNIVSSLLSENMTVIAPYHLISTSAVTALFERPENVLSKTST